MIPLHGWNGRILRVDLTKRKTAAEAYDADFALKFIGGRGFAAKILWDETKPGLDPFSPDSRLVFATGPLTGFSLPSSGKLVVAAKSPLTGGYGDGNIGTLAAVHLRRAGFDALILQGKAEKPSYVTVENEKVEVLDAEGLWGLGAIEAERKLREKHGKDLGILTIGPAGENLVKYATIVSQEGRAGGRPGVGAVMGSKKAKAIVIKGTKNLVAADPNGMRTLGMEGYKDVLAKPNYAFWKRQGTMSTIEWSQTNSVLPSFNFREGIFDEAEKIGGTFMETIKTSQKGCPNCNMTCGNVVTDAEKQPSELDYENVAMLGSNIGLGDLKQVAVLNRLADDFGLDTISLGNVIGFAMEASEKKLIMEKVEWGDFHEAKRLVGEIAYRRGIGDLLSKGTKAVAEKLGRDSPKWAMHVKGLEVSGYDCHSAPAMALAYGTCSIGAHHKEAWIISWEVTFGRESYGVEKVDKLIELQRIRGGAFESLTVCRLPWVELGFGLDWYPKLFKAATGVELSWNELYAVGDRIYSLIRAFWVREYGSNWSRAMDQPPQRWFEEPLTKGPFKGATLDRQRYDQMLSSYYERHGWNQRGIPYKATLEKLGLGDVSQQLGKLAP